MCHGIFKMFPLQQKCWSSGNNPSIQIHSLSPQATSITVCFPPKHRSQQQKTRRKVTRWELSREQTLGLRGVGVGLFPREQFTEALPNRELHFL